MAPRHHANAMYERQIAGSMTGALIGYLRRSCDDGVVDAVLRRAGESRSADVLCDPTVWSSYAEAIALFAAAADVVGDDDIGRKAGQELLAQYAGTEVAALLRSLGSPAEVLRNVAETAAKYSTVTSMEALEVADGDVLVAARTKGGVERHPHFCRYTEGVLSQ